MAHPTWTESRTAWVATKVKIPTTATVFRTRYGGPGSKYHLTCQECGAVVVKGELVVGWRGGPRGGWRVVHHACARPASGAVVHAQDNPTAAEVSTAVQPESPSAAVQPKPPSLEDEIAAAFEEGRNT